MVQLQIRTPSAGPYLERFLDPEQIIPFQDHYFRSLIMDLSDVIICYATKAITMNHTFAPITSISSV